MKKGDTFYVTRTGHPCKGMLVEFDSLTVDPTIAIVKSTSGGYFYVSVEDLVPAPQPVPASTGKTRPCPDCAHTSHPGKYWGYNSVETCGTCKGTLVILDNCTAKPEDSNGRWLPISDSNFRDTVKIGTRVRVAIGQGLMQKEGDTGVVIAFRENAPWKWVDINFDSGFKSGGNNAKRFEAWVPQ